jgi:serine/threonine protein phosphatase PrpC
MDEPASPESGECNPAAALVDTIASAPDPTSGPAWSIEVSSWSEINAPHREEQEDAIAVLRGQWAAGAAGWREAVVIALSDGAGGHEDGARAAGSAITCAGRVIAGLQAATDLDQLPELVQEVIARVNREYLSTSRGRPASAATLALVTIVVDQWLGSRLVIASVGDTVVFLKPAGELLYRLTTPHRQVQQLVDEGVLTEEEALLHPDASVLVSALGAYPILPHLDLLQGDLAAPCTLVLAVDGVWASVPIEQIDQIVSRTPDAGAARDLVRAALAAGSQDNSSAVVVTVRDRRDFVAAPEEPVS